ncbi:MAG: hypothetical protein ACTTKL_07410 [Treponema sp.]
MIMLFFHRHHVLKYLYLINFLCLLIAVVAYFILIRHPVGYEASKPWIQVMPFVWLVGLWGGYALSILSVAAFVIEHAQRHLWAKATIGISSLILLFLCIWWGYLFIKGILSLKSG